MQASSPTCCRYPIGAQRNRGPSHGLTSSITHLTICAVVIVGSPAPGRSEAMSVPAFPV